MPDIWVDVDTALAEVPVNILPLIDDTDFKTIEAAIVYNAAGMALIWHFVTTAGVMTETAVTPTTGGVHDWTDQGTSGLYSLEIPASAGTINNDTEGFGWFTGVCTGVLPWRGPTIGFRAAALNNALIDGGDVLDVSLTEIGGVAQSATDLKDFADEGYDPATNKVQGVVLVDTVTALTGHIVQTGDSYARIGAAGAGLTGVPWNASWDAEVQSEVNDGLVAFWTSPATLVDLVWDEDVDTSHQTAGTAGKKLDDAGAAADPWTTALPGAYGAGTAGYIIGNNLDAAITSRSSHSQSDVWSVATRLLTAGTNIALAKGVGVTGFNDISAANVNSEVSDVLKTDTIAERTQSIPPTTPTFEEAISYLYMALRNAVDVDSGFKEFNNNAGTVIWKKALTDDGSNYVEAKGESGP